MHKRQGTRCCTALYNYTELHSQRGGPKRSLQSSDVSTTALVRSQRPSAEQVSDKERALEQEVLFRDVAAVLSEKCVNPDTNRPYTISMLERALKDVHFSVDLHKGAKQQALEVGRDQGCVCRCSAAPLLHSRVRFCTQSTILLCAEGELNSCGFACRRALHGAAPLYSIGFFCMV